MEHRYNRQILMDEVTKEGQSKLLNSKVLVVGAGGLGCPVLTYLAMAGLGEIHVMDDDHVSETNLNRQFFYGPHDIGTPKVLVAKERLQEQNPDIHIKAYNQKLTEDNIYEFIRDKNVVIDCVDNVETRLLLNRCCLELGILLVEASVHGFYGMAMVIAGDRPCLECLGYNELMEEIHQKDSKIPVPVIGITAGMVGVLQANLCITYLLGIESLEKDKILQYDGKKNELSKIRVKIKPGCHLHD